MFILLIPPKSLCYFPGFQILLEENLIAIDVLFYNDFLFYVRLNFNRIKTNNDNIPKIENPINKGNTELITKLPI